MNRRDILKLAPLATLAPSAFSCGDALAKQSGSDAGATPSTEPGWLVGSLGAKWNRSALVIGLAFQAQDPPGRSSELRWSNQGFLGMRSGVELKPQSGSDEPLLGVQSVRLAPGRYLFNQLIARPWKLTPKDGAEEKVKPEDLRVAFDVQPGRVTYFGELAAWLTADTPLFLGLGIPREMAMTLRDRAERDLTALRRSGLQLPEGELLKVDWTAGALPTMVSLVPSAG